MKWEYEILFIGDESIDNVINNLRLMGEEGWELCACNGNKFYFKRIIQESIPKMSFQYSFPGLDSDK